MESLRDLEMRNSKDLSSNINRFYPWLVWVLGAAFFFSEYLGRISLNVMVPELMAAFKVTAFGIGSMSAFFYYAYLSMQIPVGSLVDRFGPHRLLTVMSALCALGCFLFAISSNATLAHLARFIMGFGAAFAFVGTLKLAGLWFPSNRFGLLAGLTQALGMLGAAVGAGPLAVMVTVIGWRGTIGLVGGILLLLAVFIGLLVRDHPAEHPRVVRNLATNGELWKGFIAVLHNPQSWWNALYAGLLYAPTAAFAELWGVSFLVRTYGLTTNVAASAISTIFIGWAIGGPVMGWISDRMGKRRPVMIFSVIASFIFISLVLFLPKMWTPLLFLFLFLYGMSNTGVATSYAVASEINSSRVSGTSMAFANMASVLVGAAFQPIIGGLLDIQWDGRMVNGVPFYTAHAFRMAMAALPLCLVLGFIVILLVRETHCRNRESGN